MSMRPSHSVVLLGFFAISASLCGHDALPAYYWRSTLISARAGQPPTATLLTLFCSACGVGEAAGHAIPLVAVLRDSLGDNDPNNDKLTAVWLLTYSRPTLGQKAVAAVPFFYWKLSDGSAKVGKHDTAPLLDLTAPEHPALSNVERLLLQMTTLDTLNPTLRATSREYRTNQVDHERLHLEEASNYLLRAPADSGPDSLTVEERDFVMARLELRKSLLGGFASAERATALARQAIFQQEEIRSRNWELLRQCAERTGLFFEPLNIGEAKSEYGMLWFPVKATGEPGGQDLRPIWKLLNLKNPYADDRLTNWDGPIQSRSLDKNGLLLPPDSKGVKAVSLIPLGVYSLNYPRVPLLMVDFRDGKKLRRHELLQRSVNEVTSGVIGISHFTNWYYYLAADFYNFYQGRHGKATSRAERLDCYSQFRVALTLDHALDADLRQEMQRRVNLLSVNPLESSEDREMTAAVNRYSRLRLQAAGDDGLLYKAVDKQRREELASFGESSKRQIADAALHALTFGKYSHSIKRSDGNLELLSRYRLVQYQLAFLDQLLAAGTAPEVTYQQTRIRSAVAQLTELMPGVKIESVRTHAKETLDRLGKLSDDLVLRADCERASASVDSGGEVYPSEVPGIVAAPSLRENLK